MRKFYQSEWQGINFNEFSNLSSVKLADAEFYNLFYAAFFKRYQNWGQLSAAWRSEKEECAKFVLSQCKGNTLLSIGCGLGYMEKHIQSSAPEKALFIHEVAPTAWHWIQDEFKDDSRILGFIPACLPENKRFDLIYLSAVDYALDDDELISLLSSVRPFLNHEQEGKCLLISASFEEEPLKLTIKTGLKFAKKLVLSVLYALHIRKRGQFWGWTRRQKDYYSMMNRAGYYDIQEGFIDMENKSHYWISGRSGF